MKCLKMIGASLLAALALGAVLASAATAAPPEFLHEGKEVTLKGFKVKSKTGLTIIELSGTTYKITCSSNTAEGKIKGKTEVEKVTGKFKGCKAKKGKEEKECEVKSTSPEGKKEEIVTKELKGHLGVVAHEEAESEVGLILEPASGEVYVTIKGSTECLPKEMSEVKGSLIGEITPVKKEQLTGELLDKIKGEKEQMIKKFVGETSMHELELFEVKTPLEAKDEITFEEKVEVN
jgi:hypothetical protein